LSIARTILISWDVRFGDGRERRAKTLPASWSVRFVRGSLL
jgi:hypothetical protein